MKRALVIEFTKMNGAGNDFIVIDNRFYHFSVSELSTLAQSVCSRRIGIGADGLLALAPSEIPDADYRMIYINADGSIGTMCGNGARCLARFAHERGIDKRSVLMQTSSGNCEVFIPEHGQVRVYLDVPKNYIHPFVLEADQLEQFKSVHYVWPGTQHLVCFTKDIHAVSTEYWGPILRKDRNLGSEGANVNFVEVDTHMTRLRVRTYEKGVEDETLACGTGAIASVYAARKSGMITEDICQVEMQGGMLTVGLEKQRVFLEGPSTYVYRGSFEYTSPDRNMADEGL